jgi:demethylmenaquinone methyltransferase/2-methoxy-6-polyprenyl-1,4-benzoquinol methylase
MPPAPRVSGEVPPLPPLPAFYDGDDQRRQWLSRLFDHAAPHYDRIEALMSFGFGPRFRRSTLRRAGLTADMTVLDVAVGTGALARAALALLDARGRVVGVDPSFGMLAQAQKLGRIALAQGLAEHLPFRDGAFDFVTMGYALRHVADLRRTFAEYHRVLRPGGRLVILDFARPASRAGFALARGYLGLVVPWMAGKCARHDAPRLLMRYCWASLEHCVSPETVEATIAEAGFRVSASRRWVGVLSEYVAVRP